jgi:hypothetical protein
MKLNPITVCIALLILPMLGHAQNTPTTEPLVVVHGGQYGYIDHDGAMLIPPQYRWGADFEDGFGAVYVCGRVVSIDPNGKLSPLRTGNRTNQLMRKKVGDKFGFFDSSRRLRVAAEFDDALPFSEGLAAVQVKKKWGFIDENGSLVIPAGFDAAYYFREGVANAEIDGVPVLIDKTGKLLASGFDQLRGVTAEGLIPVSRNGKAGYLNLKGAIAIPLVFEETDTFSEGLGPVQKGSKWGYIDKNGKTVIPFKFDSAGVFGNRLAPARIGEQSGFIDTAGEFVFRLKFDYAPGFWGLEGNTDVSRFWTKDGLFGYVNSSGKVIWGPTTEMPDHAPITGWDEQDRIGSCENVPSSIRNQVASFPPESL